MLEHAEFRYNDKGKLARDCTPVAAPCWTYDKRTLMMPFILRSLQPDKVVKQIPVLPSDFIESHARWSQYGSEDVRIHQLGMRKGYQMFSNYGQLAEELKVGLGAIDLSRDQPMTSTKLLSSHQLLFLETVCPPTMKTDVTYKVRMSILVEPNEKSRKILWAAVEMIVCECSCKAGRSRKCPHALALLYLIDNYHQVSEFGTGLPKNQTWWKPPFSNKIPLTQPISHVSFCHSTPLVAGPHLNRKREHDHVRGTTDGRHKPDRWDTVIDKLTPKEFLDPIGTNASAIWAPFFAEVQQHRASKAAAGELSSDTDSEHSAD